MTCAPNFTPNSYVKHLSSYWGQRNIKPTLSGVLHFFLKIQNNTSRTGQEQSENNSLHLKLYQLRFLFLESSQKGKTSYDVATQAPPEGSISVTSQKPGAASLRRACAIDRDCAFTLESPTDAHVESDQQPTITSGAMTSLAKARLATT